MNESMVSVLGFVRATDMNSEKWNELSTMVYSPKIRQPSSKVVRYSPEANAAPRNADLMDTCSEESIPTIEERKSLSFSYFGACIKSYIGLNR